VVRLLLHFNGKYFFLVFQTGEFHKFCLRRPPTPSGINSVISITKSVVKRHHLLVLLKDCFVFLMGLEKPLFCKLGTAISTLYLIDAGTDDCEAVRRARVRATPKRASDKVTTD